MLLSKSLIQLKIGCKSFSDALLIFISTMRFTLCKPFSSEFENLRSKWLIGLPEPTISGYKEDFCCQMRFHRTSKKAYNYFYFTKLKDLVVLRRILESSRLAKKKNWLKSQSEKKSGAQK